MALNFKIVINRKNDNLLFDLKGDFDGSSAFELINAIQSNLKDSERVRIDTCNLKKVYPFGREVFNKNLFRLKDVRIRILFTSPAGSLSRQSDSTAICE